MVCSNFTPITHPHSHVLQHLLTGYSDFSYLGWHQFWILAPAPFRPHMATAATLGPTRECFHAERWRRRLAGGPICCFKDYSWLLKATAQKAAVQMAWMGKFQAITFIFLNSLVQWDREILFLWYLTSFHFTIYLASCNLLCRFIFQPVKDQGRVYRALKSNSKWYLSLCLPYTASKNVTICEQYAEMTSLAKCWQNTGEKHHKTSYKDHFKVIAKFANTFFLIICSSSALANL